jgi:hypothetical protein
LGSASEVLCMLRRLLESNEKARIGGPFCGKQCENLTATDLLQHCGSVLSGRDPAYHSST